MDSAKAGAVGAEGNIKVNDMNKYLEVGPTALSGAHGSGGGFLPLRN